MEIEGVVVTGMTHASEERYCGMWVQQGRTPLGDLVFFGSSSLPEVTPARSSI